MMARAIGPYTIKHIIYWMYILIRHIVDPTRFQRVTQRPLSYLHWEELLAPGWAFLFVWSLRYVPKYLIFIRYHTFIHIWQFFRIYFIFIFYYFIHLFLEDVSSFMILSIKVFELGFDLGTSFFGRWPPWSMKTKSAQEQIVISMVPIDVNKTSCNSLL